MADRNEKIPFTMGAQLDIERGLYLAEEMNKKLDPTLPVRVTSLENTRESDIKRNKQITATVIGGVLLFLFVWGIKALLMASTGIPMP